MPFTKMQADTRNITMAGSIFINLPAKNLDKSTTFFTKLGFGINSQFTDEKATCIILGKNIFLMLLMEDFFKTFTKKEISDPTKDTEAIFAISAESREKVDEMMDKVIQAGGTTSGETQDHGWMYDRGFQDLDGHLWEILYMDPRAIQQPAGRKANTHRKQPATHK